MNTTYKKADSEIPSYISTLANPMRRVHNDNILATESSVMSTTTSDPNYPNFKIKAFNSRRSSTMLGRRTLLWSTSSLERALSWVRNSDDELFYILDVSSQSLREASEWVLSTLSLPLEDFLACALASASSPSWRSFTGYSPLSAGTFL